MLYINFPAKMLNTCTFTLYWLWNQGFIVTHNLSWKDRCGIEEQGSNPFISKMEITSHTLNLNSIYFLLSGKNKAVQNHFLTFRKSEAVQKWSSTGCAVTCSGGGRAPKLFSVGLSNSGNSFKIEQIGFVKVLKDISYSKNILTQHLQVR